MIIEDKNLLKQFTLEFCKIVEKHTKYMIISGFTAIATGRTRGTEDIDIIIEKIDFKTFEELHKDLTRIFEPFETDKLEEIYQRLDEGTNIRYVYKNTLLPNMELKFAKDKVDEVGLLNRIQIPLTNLDIYFGPVSSTIAFKETILTSKKDQEDAIHLREAFEGEIDEAEVKYFKELIKRYR